MAGADWSSTITINIVLDPSPPSRQGFGVPLLMVDQDDGNDLDGDRVVSYASASEAETAQGAGDISADTLAWIQAAFTQQPTISKVKVGYRDTGGSETVAAAIAAIRAADDDWYGLAIYSRADADILAASAAVETLEKFFVGQSDDSSWLDSGLPSGLSALASRERTAIVYHDEDDEPADLSWLASRLVWDPDTISSPWDGQVRGIAPLTTGLTSAQRDFIESNKANVALPFSSAQTFMGPGQNCAGRGIYEIISADWLRARIREDVAELKLKHTNRGEKIIVDASGQAKVLNIIAGRLQQGEQVGHFVKGQTRASAEAITSTDLSLRRLRFKAEAQIAQDARLFVFNVYLQRDALQPA